jgi:hypothetical protein
MGYKFNYINLALNHLTYNEIMQKFGPFIKDKSKATVVRVVTNAAWTVFAVDNIYAKAGRLRCSEKSKGQTDLVMQHFEGRVRTELGFHNIRDAIFEARRGLGNVYRKRAFHKS